MTSNTEKRQRRRLTDYDIVTIRAAVRDGAPLEDLAEGYDVSVDAIQEAAFEHPDSAAARTSPLARRPSHLSESQVREIRTLYPAVAVPDLAERFDVSVWTVDLICRGVLWKHVLL